MLDLSFVDEIMLFKGTTSNKKRFEKEVVSVFDRKERPKQFMLHQRVVLEDAEKFKGPHKVKDLYRWEYHWSIPHKYLAKRKSEY